MLRLIDALRLTGTKLRTRKIRLSITMIVSSLLFATLLAGLTAIYATKQSLERFDTDNLNGRFLLNQNVHKNNLGMSVDRADLMVKAEQQREELIKEKQAAAKRLGIDYDPKSEPEVVEKFDDYKMLVSTHPIVVKLMQEENAKSPELTQQAQDEFATSLGAIASFPAREITPVGGALIFMDGGRENFSEDTDFSLQAQDSPKAELMSRATNDYVMISNELLGGYLLSDTKLSPGEIPLIVRHRDAETLMNLTPLGPGASVNEQIDRLKTLRQKSNDLTFSLCWRNSASRQLLTTALEQKKMLEKQAKLPAAERVKPDFEYQLPTEESCGEVAIIKDNRPAAQKALDEKQRQFDAQFNPEKLAPAVQQKLTFRIVGLMPDDPEMAQSGLSSFLYQFMNNRLSYSWIIPEDTSPESAQQNFITLISENQPSIDRFIRQNTIYEFDDPEKARHYMQTVDCVWDDEPIDGPMLMKSQTKSDLPICLDGYFLSSAPIGSNSLVIYDAMQRLQPIIFWSFVGVTALASFILLIMIGRTIADSRRESAVFRALGATRFSISQIYLTYTVAIASFIAILSVGLGLLAVKLLDKSFSGELTTTLRAGLTPSDLETTFSFWLIDWRIIGAIIAGIIIAALTASFLPLLRNTRRNPIKDMRDE